jgi:putative SOS response-associated peptidase YedK
MKLWALFRVRAIIEHMCGRFALTDADADKLTAVFSLGETPEVAPRYNVAPTQDVAAVVYDPERAYNRLRMMRWGLVPHWAKDTSFASKLINARGETVHEKASFRDAFKRQRCLIIADGFYEWQKQDDGPKQPMFIHLKSREPFGMAGLYSNWTDPQTGDVLTTCTIITTAANTFMQLLHQRMPLILSPDRYAAWLDPQNNEPEFLRMLMQPISGSKMAYYPVSRRVNKPDNDDPSVIERVG